MSIKWTAEVSTHCWPRVDISVWPTYRSIKWTVKVSTHCWPRVDISAWPAHRSVKWTTELNEHFPQCHVCPSPQLNILYICVTFHTQRETLRLNISQGQSQITPKTIHVNTRICVEHEKDIRECKQSNVHDTHIIMQLHVYTDADQKCPI